MARTSKVAPRDQSEGLSNEQRIGMLLQQGLDNDSIFYSLSRLRSNLATMDDDNQRAKLAEKFHIVDPGYDKIAHQRLLEQIRKCKSKYMKENEELDLIDSMRDEDGSARHIREIEAINIPRFSLGIPSLDGVLGTDPESGTTGMPRGCCLIFGAGKGVGKTRLTVQIAAHVGAPNFGADKEAGLEGVMYIQNEEKLEIFKSRAAQQWSDRHKIWISSSDNLIQHAALLHKHKPRLAIIDSIQDTRQARFSAGIRHMLSTYKAIAESTGISFWLISHVNGEGRIKGGTYAGHKVDIEMLASRVPFNPSEFIVSCDEKNRYGQTGKKAVFRHTDEGIVPVETVVRNRAYVMSTAKISLPLSGALRRDSSTEPAGGVPDDE